MAPRAHGRRERIDGVGEAAEDEARTEAERSVVDARLVRRLDAVAELEADTVGEPGRRSALRRDRMEVRGDLDAVDTAPEGLREHERRPPASGGDVEHPRFGPEFQPPTQQ